MTILFLEGKGHSSQYPQAPEQCLVPRHSVKISPEQFFNHIIVHKILTCEIGFCLTLSATLQRKQGLQYHWHFIRGKLRHWEANFFIWNHSAGKWPGRGTQTALPIPALPLTFFTAELTWGSESLLYYLQKIPSLSVFLLLLLLRLRSGLLWFWTIRDSQTC